MYEHYRPIAFGALIAGVATLVFLQVSHFPDARASEGPVRTVMSTMNELLPRPIDPDNLVRIGDAAWSVTADPSVSLTPLTTTIITKISFGKRELVEVSTTSTGVYSSDAMVSPYVSYPGIHVSRVHGAHADSDADSLAYWSPQLGWVPAPAITAGSFISIAPLTGGGAMIQKDGTTCVLTYTVAAC